MKNGKIIKIGILMFIIAMLMLTPVSAGLFDDIFGNSGSSSGSCTDSDNGDFSETPGTVKIVTSTLIPTEYKDICSGDGTKLTEYTCTEDNNYNFITHTCQGQCVTDSTGQGYCSDLPQDQPGQEPGSDAETEPLCLDTDNGETYDTKGQIKINGKIKAEDGCNSFAGICPSASGCGDGDYLIEWKCDSEGYTEGAFSTENYAPIFFECPNGCVNGACIPELGEPLEAEGPTANVEEWITDQALRLLMQIDNMINKLKGDLSLMDVKIANLEKTDEEKKEDLAKYTFRL